MKLLLLTAAFVGGLMAATPAMAQNARLGYVPTDDHPVGQASRHFAKLVKVPDISMNEEEPIAVVLPQPFEVDLAAKTTQVVKNNDLVAQLEVMIGTVAADETSASSDNNPHISTIPIV